MKQIPLTQGKFAIVDDDVYVWAKDYKWFAHKGRHTFYARRMILINRQRKGVLLHHAIIGFPLENKQIDHIDGDGLNNQRYNLRIVTNRSNHQNLEAHRQGHLVGTYLIKDHYRTKPWKAVMRVNGKKKTIGYFATQQEAYEAYIETSKELI
jgi:hypothetical protein